jgi:phospholipase/carboxylesterase
MTLLPYVQIETGPSPTSAVIWLHGLGADGHDFAGLVPELNLSSCGSIRFIFPHAPSRPVTINGGYVMPAWYDIPSSELTQRQDSEGIAQSERQIIALIENENSRGIPPERIVLAGFSQGCAMALHTGLRYSSRLAGIMALSGYLPLADRFSMERQSVNARTPIFMAHGTMDNVVPLIRAEESRDLLKALHYSVEWHSYPMQHSVHPQEISDISNFLQAVLVDCAADVSEK